MNTAPNRRASDNASSPPGTSPTRRFSDMLKESSGSQSDVKRIFITYDETVEVDPEPLAVNGITLTDSIMCLSSPESSDSTVIHGTSGNTLLIPLDGLPQELDSNKIKNIVKEIPDIVYLYMVSDQDIGIARKREITAFKRYPLTPEDIAGLQSGVPYLRSEATVIIGIYDDVHITYISSDAVIAVKDEDGESQPIK